MPKKYCSGLRGSLIPTAQGCSERGESGVCGCDIPPKINQSAFRATVGKSKVLEQGLAHNKFSVGKPRAMGLPMKMYRVSRNYRAAVSGGSSSFRS